MPFSDAVLYMYAHCVQELTYANINMDQLYKITNSQFMYFVSLILILFWDYQINKTFKKVSTLCL